VLRVGTEDVPLATVTQVDAPQETTETTTNTSTEGS